MTLHNQQLIAKLYHVVVLFKNHNVRSREFGNINVIQAVASIKLTFFALAKRDPFRIHCTESGKNTNNNMII